MTTTGLKSVRPKALKNIFSRDSTVTEVSISLASNRNGNYMASTIFGPGTLFLRDGSAARDIEREEHNSVWDTLETMELDDAEREKESWRLQQLERRKMAGWVGKSANECVPFIVGKGNSAVHSEPDSRSDRIFVSVLPGRQYEVRDLAERWGCPWGHALR